MTPQQRITAAEAAVTALAGMTETRSITPVYLAAVLTKMIEICIDELADRQSVDANLTQTCQTLSQSISTETSNREEAIEDEVTARNQAIATAKTTLEQAITYAVSTLCSAIAAEESAREEAIEDEVTARNQAIASAKTTLEQALASAVSTLSSTIAAEETRAKGQEQANVVAIEATASAAASAVSTEATARQAGDAEITAALTIVDGKVVLNDEIAAAILANLNGRIKAIEESIKNGFAGLTVDNLFVKTGMRSYFFNGETDDDALVVVRAYAPNFIPKCYAQRWFDTAAKKWYKPTELTSVNDWVVDN